MLDTRFRLAFTAVLGGWLAACGGSLATSAREPSPQLTAATSSTTPQPSAAASESVRPLPPSAAAEADAPPAPLAADATTPAPAAAATDTAADARYLDVISDRTQLARGLYFNAPLARKLGARGVANMVLGAGLDAAVIDIKDGEGRVTFDTQVPELQPGKRVIFKDPAAFVRELKAAGVYTIARVVCFSDPSTPRAFPDRAVMDGRPGHEGEIWLKDKQRNTWLDPYNTKNHDMLVSLVKEVEALGFDEIQLDYIRFPVDVATKFAVFPAQTDKPRSEVLLELLARMDEALHIPLGADVFGLTAFNRGDPTGLLGQDLVKWTRHIDVFSPMLYVYGMSTWMGHVKDGRAGLLVEQGVKELRQRVGPVPVIRAFLQAFPNRADYWNAQFITEQIRGARMGGGDGFLFWHPGSSYEMVRTSMQGAARALCPFPVEQRREPRKEASASKPSGNAEPAVANEALTQQPTG